MELNVPILQVVGYQNSGKTTLITKIIDQLSHEGLRIATLKHHGHGGPPTAMDEGKDSNKHRQAGAVVTGVEGEGMLQLNAINLTGWTLAEMLSIYEKLPIDLLLLEGFKKAAFPKVVLLRTKEDEHLLNELEDIMLVIQWYRKYESTAETVPTFYIDNENDYLKRIYSYLKG